MLIVGRAVAGIGGSGLTNGAITILSAAAPKQQQLLLIGIMMGLSQIAIVCGPLLGGAFTQHASWRWCFYINLPVGALAAILLLATRIPKRVPTSDCTTSPPRAAGVRAILSQLDLLGFAFFAGFAVMISLALEWGGSDYKWDSSVIIGLFCGTGISLVVLGFWERYVGNSVAMIPFSVAGRRQVWCSCLFLGFFSGALLTFSYYLPIYFQAVKNVSSTMSGVYMLPGIGGQIVMAIVSGAIIGKTGCYVPWALASGIIVPVSAGLISTFQPHTSIATWVIYQFLGGFGRVGLIGGLFGGGRWERKERGLVAMDEPRP